MIKTLYDLWKISILAVKKAIRFYTMYMGNACQQICCLSFISMLAKRKANKKVLTDVICKNS